MKFGTGIFVLVQILDRSVNGLVHAGYKTPSKVAGISSLDRYRCGENYVGFEYTGYMISADGSCVGIPYGWSGTVPADSEWIQKSWNCNLFNVPIALFRTSAENYIFYITSVPGDVTIGSRVEVVFEPKDPWNKIVLALKDDQEVDVIIRVCFRKDYGKIQLNSYISGEWIPAHDVNDLTISTDNDATLTLEVLANSIKVSVNGIEMYTYPQVVDPERTRIIDFHPATGSNCLLRSICFYKLK